MHSAEEVKTLNHSLLSELTTSSPCLLFPLFSCLISCISDIFCDHETRFLAITSSPANDLTSSVESLQ